MALRSLGFKVCPLFHLAHNQNVYTVWSRDHRREAMIRRLLELHQGDERDISAINMATCIKTTALGS